MATAFISPLFQKSDAYRLLRYAFERLYALPCPEVAKTPEGKPYFPLRPDVFFSLSHTEDMAMVCLGAAPCGCDVQLVRPLRPGTAAYVCREEELLDFDFFQLWTLKESFIKLRGRFIPYKDMVFRRVDGTVAAPAPDVRSRLYEVKGHAAAVCALEEPPAALISVPAKNLP